MQTIEIPMSLEKHSVSDAQQEERRGVKRKISLTCCGVCGTEEARYRCPGCMTYSCSLLCVKKHKALSGCSGVRDRTTFVAQSQFDEIHLLNDYRFLEDLGRLADGATRDPLKHQPHPSQRVKKLARQARHAKVTLKFLPKTFSRSRENSTYFNAKEKQFHWHLHLLFPRSGSDYTERRVADNTTIEEILSCYIHPTESDPVKRQRLKIYAQVPTDQIRVFLKAEGRRPNSPRYHQLDVKRSLRENLEHKTILEYPELYVDLRDHCQDYITQQPGTGAVHSRPGDLHAPGNTARQETTTDVGHGAPPPPEKTAMAVPEDEEIEDGEIRSTDDDEAEDGGGQCAVNGHNTGGSRQVSEQRAGVMNDGRCHGNGNVNGDRDHADACPIDDRVAEGRTDCTGTR